MAGMALTNRWAVLALLFVVRLGTPLHFQALASVAPELVADLGLTYAELGALIGMTTLPGVFLALPCGLLGQRFGDKPVVLAGLGLLAAGGLLVAAAGSYPVAVGGRLLGGVGMVLLHVQLVRMVMDWFAGREVTTAIALLLVTWPLGIAMALASLGAIAAQTSWQTAVAITAVLPALAMVAVALLYAPAGHAGAPSPASPGALWRLSRREAVLVSTAGTTWMVWNVGFVLFVSFAPLLLVEQGHKLAWAGVLISLPLWLSLGSTPLGGYLIDRTGRANLLIGIAIAGSTAATALLPLALPVLALPVVLIAMGVVRGPCAGGVNALPAEVLRPGSRSAGMGLYQTFYYLGMTALPPLAGWLQDLTGSPAAPVLLAAAGTGLTAVPLLAFRVLQRRWPAGPVAAPAD